MSEGRFKNPVEATLTGIKDLFGKQDLEGHLKDSDRLDGKVAMVTGANSGLGFAIAVDLAKRGAHVIMACRSGIPQKGEEVKKLSGSTKVEMRKIDLKDFDSINAFCDGLRDDKVKLDICISNAGVAPPKARKTKAGLDEIFQVNFLAKVVIYHRLLGDGVIPNASFANNRGQELPRIIFVSSDSHQGASALDWDEFGVFFDYGVNKSINFYSYYKLMLNTYATELSRHLTLPDGKPDVSVNVMCPGPVNSNIARDAPKFLLPFMKFIFWIFFRSPKKAAEPVSYLASSAEVEGKSNYYLHMFNEKEMDPKVYDPAEGKKLWERSFALLKGLGVVGGNI